MGLNPFDDDGISDKNLKFKCPTDQEPKEDGVIGPCEIVHVKDDGQEVSLGEGKWERVKDGKWKRIRTGENSIFNNQTLSKAKKIEEAVIKHFIS